MNSYPPELLVQLAPVMFVAGLDAPLVPPSSPAPSTTSKSQDAFAVLTMRLRDALLNQRKVAIWQPEKAKSFQVILVDRDVRFPPRKMAPNDDSPHLPGHSPLSPLTPSSPLHPDGLIAPIWIRKHTTLVPSVFVLFMRIFEEQEERKRDVDLAAYIALRKKSTNERGIKLTVVLLASRRMLDDPSLDARLTFIRKQSGLDARAALFVLSPVSQAELGDFVQSLQQALYEPAVEYYTSHSKRVRRKRNRHTQALSSYSNPISPLGTAGASRPLRPEGWTVRYEYKMACFAEFRGEDEVALKHYQDAYEVLAIMFGSIAILPPRTKRWAEAKVLADCINVKIVKLYMYNNEHALALSHHTTHIRKFGDLSRGWSIGEDTFEYWSWVARQYRILSELMEQGTHSSLTYLLTNRSSPQAASRGSTPALELDGLRSLGLNPSHALQHPGFYYYMAARCTEMRRERFLATLEAEARLFWKRGVSSSPGFANEKKVDHLLYTKAYELFKKHTPTLPQSQSQARLTLWIAYRIGQTYFDSGKFDMAVRFFERIARTYRRESWDTMLRPLLTTWYACVQQLGDVELSVRLLIEMLGHGLEDVDEPGTLQGDLLEVLKSTVPTTPDEPLLIDSSESQPICKFDCDVVFWQTEVKVGESAAFQMTITAPEDVAISDLPFTSLTITFAGTYGPVTLQHVDGESSNISNRYLSLGTISEEPKTLETSLRWQQGSSLILSGTMVSHVPTTLRVEDLDIQIPLDPTSSRTGSPQPLSHKWLSCVSPPRFIDIKREDPSSVFVRYRSHSVELDLSHPSPACIDEEYPITIEVTNVDDQDLEIFVDILLQPTEVDDADNSIIIDGESSSSFIKGVPFGTLSPGENCVKVLHLTSTGGAGDRILDISLQSRSKKSFNGEPIEDVSEVLKTVVVPTVAALSITHDIVYRRSLKDRMGLADLRAFDEDFWDDGQGGEAEVNLMIECAGPWSILMEKLTLQRQDNDEAKVLEASSDDDDSDLPSEYFPGDQFSVWCRISLSPSEYPSPAIPSVGQYAIHWRRIHEDGTHGPSSKSTVSLPSLRPPTDGLIGLLHIAPTARLHQTIPLSLIIRNNHPSRAANITVHVELDPSDGFVISGIRNGRIPILLPGSEEKVMWNLIPIECGHVALPRIKVIDRRKVVQESTEAEEELVKIVDVRLDYRREEAEEKDEDSESPTEKETNSPLAVVGTVFVSP
ncbi:Gryzun, putative trafficking through golgi-domain-containing protein [Mucidula mucida]|nr:Gryzun, putative trafficking through golgi-domain-containing protein [Mucidula mucida]